MVLVCVTPVGGGESDPHAESAAVAAQIAAAYQTDVVGVALARIDLSPDLFIGWTGKLDANAQPEVILASHLAQLFIFLRMSTGSPRFFLSSFGTLRVLDAAGQPALGDHGHQRRRIALLAVLAAAGSPGRSRDQLLGLFWPDVDQSRARHSLEQLLYSLRNTLGSDVFSGSNPLSLNPDVIDSDIAQFSSAIDRGDLAAAAALYRGRFADGFYLGGAPEFEQWIENERNRVDAVYAEALEKLAASDEHAGDFSGAVAWRTRLAALDPLSSKHAIALIRALMNAGDHSSALQHAERYQEHVAKELGTGVGPAMMELVAEIRERAKTESVVVRGSPPPARLADTIPPTAKSDSPVEPAIETPHQSRNALILATLVLVVAIAGYTFWNRGENSPAPVGRASIAVLPLANLSGESRDMAIADGITEELIGTLSRIDRLSVIARTSAFVFRNSTLDVRQIAESLQVTHLLEGGVQKLGEKVRVQIRLIDARDGSTRWSQSFDRDVDDLFIVQAEIASAVARALDLQLAGGGASVVPRPPTANIAAYELYLRGNDPTMLRNDSTVRVALDYLNQAIAIDSTYADAYAGIARMHLRLRGTRFAPAPSEELFRRAGYYARKAVALDSLSAQALGSIGLLNIQDMNLAGAETALRRAIALDPSSSRLREWLFIAYDWQDRNDDMLEQARIAVELDPLSPTAHATLGRALCISGEQDEGLRLLDGLSRLTPPLQRVASFRALCQGMKGDWRGGIATLSPVQGIAPRGIVGNYFARLGDRENALVMIRSLEEHRKRQGDAAFEIAVVYAGLGDHDRTFQWLEQAIREKRIFHSMTEPLFDRVKADPRYRRVLSRATSQNR
jgi:adenylate cyclase